MDVGKVASHPFGKRLVFEVGVNLGDGAFLDKVDEITVDSVENNHYLLLILEQFSRDLEVINFRWESF